MSSRFFGPRRTNTDCTAASLGLWVAALAAGCSHEVGGGSAAPGTTTGSTTGTTTGSSTGTSTGATGPQVTCATEDDPASCTCEAASWTNEYAPGYPEPRDPVVDELVKKMTLEEKVTQMVGTDNGGANRQWTDLQRSYDLELTDGTKILGYMYRDGPRGLNLEAKQWNNRVPDGTNYATTFPASIAIGASWDLDLAYRVGEAQGDEVSASKNNMHLVPCMNILRHPAWGRAQETFGEDPFHIGTLATAFTAGVQQYVAGCAKHFAGNNIENDRFSQNAVMDEQTLREIYALHFEMVVQDGGVACIMAAYNKVNGVKSTQSVHLLRDILKAPVSQGGMGFRGLVISDWWAMPAGTDGKDTSIEPAAKQTNAIGGLKSGLDVEVAWALNYAEIPTVVRADPALEAHVDDAVGRILEQKARFGVLYGEQGKVNTPWSGWSRKTPTTRLDQETGSIVDNEEHLRLAQEAAHKSMVLLKNDNATLPIQGSGKTIAVLGATAQYRVRSDESIAGTDLLTVDFAKDLRTGDRGSSRVASDPAKSTSPLQGIEQIGQARGHTVTNPSTAAEAANADFIVVIVGLTAEDEGEEYTGAGDRQTFALDGKRPGNQNQLVLDALALGKPMAVVIEAGSVVDIEQWRGQVPAIVMAWYPGQHGGAALGELLLGDENFSGKLPITWGNWDDWPTFDEGGETTMDYYLGYRWFDHQGKTPIFPFGWGLSYTTFEYSNLQIPCGSATKDSIVPVKVDIKNTGEVDGEEVAMLFTAYPNADRGDSKVSAKELKGFTKVALAAGETKTVTIDLRVPLLKYWRMPENEWRVESGALDVMVGPHSANLPLKGTLTLQ